MLLLHLHLALAGIQAASSVSIPPSLTAGFSVVNTSYSNGNGAVCVSGRIPVAISVVATRLLLPEPANQTVATELIQELTQANSTLAARSNGGPSTIQGTYNIEATLCYPRNST